MRVRREFYKTNECGEIERKEKVVLEYLAIDSVNEWIRFEKQLANVKGQSFSVRYENGKVSCVHKVNKGGREYVYLLSL